MENSPNDAVAKVDETDEPSSPTDSNDVKLSDNKSNIRELANEFVRRTNIPLARPVELFFKATGNAPILKTRKWKVHANRKIGYVNTFMRKILQIDPSESLFLYVNQSFAPSLDQTVENLFSCFGTDNRLEIHYCKSQAWG